MTASHRSKINPNLQVAWDQTSLGNFLFCPRRYYYSHILNYIPRHEAVELTFGSHYHTALEVYDKALALGASFPDAQDAAVATTLRLGKGWHSEDRNRNALTLLRAIVWYTLQYQQDPAKTLILADGKPCVELSFRFDLDLHSPDGEPYIFTGHFDGVIEWPDGGIYVKERKTTKASLDSKYFQQFSPNLQVSWYFTAASILLPHKVKGVLIDAAQVAIGHTAFNRDIAFRSPELVQEFLNDLKYWVKQAERSAEENYWPKNERNCFLCAFKSICSKPPSTREMYLEAQFDKREWNPLDNR